MINARNRDADSRPVWLPPLASLAILFSIFLLAMAVRRVELGEPGRISMIALSSVAGGAITVFGGKMLVDARERGWPSALAGLVMGFLGIYTLLHVLR